MKDKAYFFGYVIGLLCIIALAITLDNSRSISRRLQKEAIERGYAERNRVTGEWQWVEPATKP